jgi:ornithine cyclodeaminase
MQQLLNTSVERVEDVSKYLYKADIITTITWVSKPLFNDDWLSQDGVHINAAGSNSLIRSEIPEKTIERSALIAVDAKDIAELECGDILPSLEKGRLHFNELSELGDIVAGKIIGRKDEKDLTIFESHGMGLQDIICAEYIYKNAVKNKIGQNLPF